MTYTIDFYRRESGQSWDDVLDAEEAAEEQREAVGGATVDPSLLSAFDRIVARAVEGFGWVPDDYDLNRDPEQGQVLYRWSGLVLTMNVDEVSLSLPYWHQGDAAALAARQLHELAGLVESETGLSGYDPQLGIGADEPTAGPEYTRQVLEKTLKAVGNLN